MEEEERRENRVLTDTDIDAESIQSRQKKGQMKSIFLSDSDEEAIVEFIKQHKELYDKINDSFKDKQKKEGLWEQLAATRNLPIKTVKKWFETQRTRYGKLTRTKSGQAAEKSTERQTWLKDSFSFLRGHIRRKGVSKSSAFKSPQRPSAATASVSVQDTSRDTESEMEISIASDVTHQPLSTSPKRRQPPVMTATTSSADPVLDQFQQATTFQLPETTQATAGREYILTIPETQTVSIPVVQPTQTSTGEPVTVIAKVQQPPRPSSSSPSSQPATSYVVVDDQHPGTSRQMIYNPPSVAPSQQEESQHNKSGLSSLFVAIRSVLQQIDTPQPFSPSQLRPAPSPVPSTTHQEQARPPRQSSQQSQNQPKSAD